jgi:Spy/CpxP family protein refolding chaperone
MSRIRRAMAALFVIAALAIAMAPAVAAASPSPPTEGGNGAGKSAQCTGPNAERPSSCQSQGGPGNRP